MDTPVPIQILRLSNIWPIQPLMADCLGTPGTAGVVSLMLILPTGSLKYSYSWNHCRILATSLVEICQSGVCLRGSQEVLPIQWALRVGIFYQVRLCLARIGEMRWVLGGLWQGKLLAFFYQWLPSKEKFWLLSRQQLLAGNYNDFFLAIERNKFILARICTFWQYKRGAMEIKMWVSPRGGDSPARNIFYFFLANDSSGRTYFIFSSPESRQDQNLSLAPTVNVHV